MTDEQAKKFLEQLRKGIATEITIKGIRFVTVKNADGTITIRLEDLGGSKEIKIPDSIQIGDVVLSLWQEGYGPALEGDYPGIETISQNSVPEDIPAGGEWNLALVRNIEGDLDEIKQEIRKSGAVLGLYYSYGMYYNDLVNEKKDACMNN